MFASACWPSAVAPMRFPWMRVPFRAAGRIASTEIDSPTVAGNHVSGAHFDAADLRVQVVAYADAHTPVRHAGGKILAGPVGADVVALYDRACRAEVDIVLPAARDHVALGITGAADHVAGQARRRIDGGDDAYAVGDVAQTP